MKKMLKRRSGFTLVELLIVIIIIGILAGAMLLVAGSGTDSAEATKIISDLRSLKAAALMFMADNAANDAPDIDDLVDYMDKDVGTGYEVDTDTEEGQWWVGKTGITGGVSTKLAPKAGDLGLFVEPGGDAFADGDDEAWRRAK